MPLPGPARGLHAQPSLSPPHRLNGDNPGPLRDDDPTGGRSLEPWTPLTHVGDRLGARIWGSPRQLAYDEQHTSGTADSRNPIPERVSPDLIPELLAWETRLHAQSRLCGPWTPLPAASTGAASARCCFSSRSWMREESLRNLSYLPFTPWVCLCVCVCLFFLISVCVKIYVTYIEFALF